MEILLAMEVHVETLVHDTDPSTFLTRKKLTNNSRPDSTDADSYLASRRRWNDSSGLSYDHRRQPGCIGRRYRRSTVSCAIWQYLVPVLQFQLL